MQDYNPWKDTIGMRIMITSVLPRETFQTATQQGEAETEQRNSSELGDRSEFGVTKVTGICNRL